MPQRSNSGSKATSTSPNRDRGNRVLTMADWYDKVVSALGLDECRTDRLFGVLEQELDGLDALQGAVAVCVCLDRLPNGRRLLMFRFGPRSEGSLWPVPVSQANAAVLEEFLRRAETFLPMDRPAGSKGSVLMGIRKGLTPARPVATMAPLLHRHFEVRIGLRLLADRSGGHSLQFLGRAARGRCKHTWRWSPAVVASWHQISSSLRGGVTDWDG